MAENSTLPKAYEPAEVEQKWYQFWMEKNLFHADEKAEGETFSIVIPPPNVTGSLHMGHALNNTLQDILCRYKRMRGYIVLWMPGTDHAGIATQNVVEKQLASEGLTRQELGREKFIERVWEWKEEYGGKIVNQLKRLGASCDWARERFTMDEGLSRAVRLVFVTLYNVGLIYRGHRIINWCPRCETALANLEVEPEDHDGFLYYIKYPIEGEDDFITVATTRPETMLGDTAVAVNPDDPRYKKYHGKKAILPLVGRILPIIADSYVEPEFGTGALKITPAHDPYDFEIGKKHNLDTVQVIDGKGKMSEAAGKYAGMDRYECREKIIEDLKEQGLLEKIEKYQHRVGHCYRCKTVIEPALSKQWFVKIKPLAEEAIKAVKENKTRIIPEQWTKNYYDWLENIEDWCISRQIWWGHRIPAWHCKECGEVTVSMETPEKCSSCGSSNIFQDTDVLDTWFSSALWPFSTLGWPEKTLELERFYPTSVLVTGFDILFFWVARMMMMGLYFMKDVPFYDVYIHALVRDAEGQKMSKSKGNVIDPLIMMDKYGTDALRFTLTAFAIQGRDIKLSEERIEGYRHFINKIWNASRFALMNLEDFTLEGDYPPKPTTLANRWILSALQKVIQEVEYSLENYVFNQAATSCYQFFWHQFCDWYLEIIKPLLYGEDTPVRKETQKTMLYVLETMLKLMHPVMPFVTEELWQKLPKKDDAPSIMVAPFPETRSDLIDEKAEKEIELITEVIGSIRNIRGEMNIPPSMLIEAECLCTSQEEKSLLESSEGTIKDLAKLANFTIRTDGDKPKAAASAVVHGMEIFVPLRGVIDFESEKNRLEKEIKKLEKEMERTQKKLQNESFLEKAPPEIVQKEKDKFSRLETKLVKLKNNYETIKSIQSEISQ